MMDGVRAGSLSMRQCRCWIAVVMPVPVCRVGAVILLWGLVGAAFGQTQPLVIDPVLVYSTYLGGNGFD